MYTHGKQFIQAGTAIQEAKKAAVLLHGRGSSAQGILSLQHHLQLTDAAIFAPQATNNTWYPHSFIAPVEQNQPALDSALSLVDHVVAEIDGHGMPLEHVFIVGFSQGACLALEYAARHARRYGGVVAFTGGLIGETLNRARYTGDFSETPVLITGGDTDPHVPLTRMEESAAILRQLGAEVTMEIYPGKPHSISADETLLANTIIFV